MGDSRWAGEAEFDQPDDISMESLFLQGSSCSPRKTHCFFSKDYEAVVDTANPSVGEFIPTHPTTEEDVWKPDLFMDRNESTSESTTSGLKRGLSTSEEEESGVSKRNPRDWLTDRKLSISESVPSGVKRGLSVSEEGEHRTPKRQLVDMCLASPQDQTDLVVFTPRSASKNIVVYASPRVIRTCCEDGSSEQEFQLTTPVVRHSRTLALRRVTSDVGNSPQFQIVSSSGKQWCSYGNKASPLERLQRMSEGSTSSRESVDIETDEDTGRLDSVGSDHDSACMKESEPDPFIQPVQPVSKGTGLVLSGLPRLPFPRMLKRQESELFEHGPEVTSTDIAFLQGKEKGDNFPNDFRLGRRRSGRVEMEGVLNSNTNPDQKEQKPLSKKEWRALSSEEKRQHLCSDRDQTALPRWGQSMPVVQNREQEERIKSAVDVFSRHDSHVIADGTVPYALPCFRGKEGRTDVYNQSHEVLQGRYSHVLDHYEIIDCRYPYEYAGGHIIGALNMYKAENIGEIMSWKNKDNDKRMVLIFHCEFSSQRGPSMMRLLRSTDRNHNFDCYPHLCHPEIYLLQGGYKEFYHHYPNLCDPQNYVPMVHSAYASELKTFLARSTSWHGKDLRFSKHSQTLLI